MFKGLVMEIKNNTAIIMKDDGSIIKIKYKDGINIGDKIIFLKEDIIDITIKNYGYKKFLSIAALFMVAILLYLNFKPTDLYAVVSLDVNPSIKLELDKNQNIIEAKGINNDGKIIDFKDIKGKNINDGMLEIKHKLIEKNYIPKNKTILFGFAFNSNTKDIQYEDKVKMIIKNNFNDNKIAFLKGDSNSINNADNKGISLGRYEASLDFDDDKLEDMIENLSVEEILDAIKNKDKYIFWNSDIEEELKDELEDKLEDKHEVDDDNDDLEDNENDNDDLD